VPKREARMTKIRYTHIAYRDTQYLLTISLYH